MLRTLNRLLWGIAIVPLAAAIASAQQRPTPEEARILLQTRPDLVAQLRDRLRASGMTPDQIRARLRAEGYPENILDAYLQDGMAMGDSMPSTSTFSAIRSLGVVDSLTLDSLRQLPLDSLEVSARRRRLLNQELVCREVSQDSLVAVPPGGDTLPRDSLAWARAQQQQGEQIRAGGRLLCRPRFSPDLAPPDSGMHIFGLDLFEGRTTLFDANAVGPVDANYRLGPGDRLVLILTGDVEAAHTLDVTREGFVLIPQVGQVHVANLTLSQLEDLLYPRLGRVYSGVRRGPNATTRFSVSVARLRSMQVFVTGEVEQPGSYRVSSAGTALTALYAARGPTENGSLRRIDIRRGGEVVGSLDVYDYLLHGDGSRDVRLQSGDVIFVPVHGPRVRVVGEVVRPATYELAEGETLESIIRAAGGFKPTASTRRVHVERIVPPELRGSSGRDRIVVDVDGDSLASSTAARVVPGDIVRVLPIANRVASRISVVGNVWSPGPQGFTPGMRLSEALARAGGPRPDAYLGQVLITRLHADSTRTQLRSVLRDTTGAVMNDAELRENDEVRVFSVAEFRPDRYVSISGAVRNSGRVPYRDGMTMRDLVLLAGGLEEGAYLGEAEIARLPENRAGGVTATTVRVPLDSSYLLARGTNGDYAGPPGLTVPGGTAPDVVLQPYDNVLIMRQADWTAPRSVMVTGEVRYPGRYTLRRRDERLREVIERAGGLTGLAFHDGVALHRKEGRAGRIGVDLRRVIDNAKHRDNLVLMDGDSLHLPAYTGVVYVAGAVNSPTGVTYVPGADLRYYVQSAGGASAKADMKRAYVTQPNGKVESVRSRAILPDGVPEPRPGSSVFVPERNPQEPSGGLNIGIIAQIIGSLVTIVAILANN